MLKKAWIGVTLLTALSLLLAACTPQEVAVIQTQIVEVEREVEVTRVVTEREEVIVEVTPMPTALPQGGFLVESTFADASILNPILSSDSASSDVHTKLFLGLVTVDAFTGEIAGEIAESWEISDDGLTYTFTLRDDIFWSDGTPVTATDIKFTYDAIASDAVETPRKDNVSLVESMEAPDDRTLVVNFTEVDCTALQNFTLGVLPEHVFDGDYAAVMESDFNTEPTVSNGPFTFEEWVADDHVTLNANPDYYLGAPNVDGWTYRVFADQSAELAATLAGEVDVTGVGPQFVSVIEGEIASGAPLQMRKYFDDGYTYVGFNLANPANPQPGWEDLNENEEWDQGEPPLPQDPHPVFSDPAVRAAVRHSIDVVNIVNKVVFGQGVPAVSNVLPAVEWAFDTSLQPPEFDLELAASILDEAGWVAGAGGVRVKDGQRLEFSLMTNAGNEVRENIATLMKDTLESIGFQVDLEIIEFGTVVQNLLGQTYDAVIIGWTGLGSDPEDTILWHYQNDVPGSGFNFVSYQNETVADDLSAARSLPGCDTGERATLYREVQNEIYNDAPYAFLYVPLANIVWNTRVGNIDPGPWVAYWNVEEWYITP